MPYAIVLYFNSDAENHIRRLWEELAAQGISTELPASGIRPHLTLAIYDELSCQPCENQLSRFAAQTAQLRLTSSHLGIFSQPEIVLFLAPTPAQSLLDFHAHIHTQVSSEGQSPWPLYQPGSWVPHITLAMNLTPASLECAVSVCAALPLPLELKATQVGAVEFLPAKDLFRYSLKEG